jgi:hypothetical protein
VCARAHTRTHTHARVCARTRACTCVCVCGSADIGKRGRSSLTENSASTCLQSELTARQKTPFCARRLLSARRHPCLAFLLLMPTRICIKNLPPERADCEKKTALLHSQTIVSRPSSLSGVFASDADAHSHQKYPLLSSQAREMPRSTACRRERDS